MTAGESSDRSPVWHGRVGLAILLAASFLLTIGYAAIGVLATMAIAVLASLVAVRRGSFRDMGFVAPRSWPKLLGTTFVYGLLVQLVFGLLVEPLIERLTGEPVELSALEGVRGDLQSYLVLLAIGWVVGGFLEELTFRGFIVGRLRYLLGGGTAATWLAVVASACAFGAGHLYQGISGMLATGLIGVVLGALYVLHRFNIWYPIFTHGFINTAGITALYLGLDRDLNRLLQ